MFVQGETCRYDVGRKVAENPRYKVHLCTSDDEDSQNLLLVVAQDGQNGVVDRWAYVLRELARHAQRVEEEYSRVKTDPDAVLNYQLQFPRVVETFKSPKGRRIIILAFESSEPSAMVPVARMIRKDNLRVDTKTSVWMMGKLLKLIGFAHSQNIALGTIANGTVLIDPDRHYVNVFDWTAATLSHVPLTEEDKRKEVLQASHVIVDALGGDLRQRKIPNDEGEEGERYNAHLWTLADGIYADADQAHLRFYQLVDRLWERGYHPFTTLPRKRT